ncbi:APC family permease [Leucobacter sp. L43]|uniref:APC family permease n=1 Tax=Leucobacter sp. L43 TaxID=2798040 RepID=UPI001906B00C|nr:APC family permease [Leucobacter sp. L43]
MTITDPPNKPDELKSGVLGAGSIALIVIAAAAPLALIAGYGPIGFLVAGIGAPAGFLIAGIVVALFIVGVVSMTRYIKRPGAFYTYIGQTLGRPSGNASATLAISAYLLVQVGGMGIISATTQNLIQILTGISIPWWIIGAVLVLLIWLVCRRGIDVGVKLILVLLTAEVALLLLVAIAVIANIAPAQGISGASFAPENVFVPGMAAASLVWFGAFFGIESTTLYRAESKDPKRSVPRATAISLVFLALFYCFVAWSIAQAFTVPELAAQIADDPTAMLYIVSEYYVGTWSGIVAQILLVTSSFSSAIAYFNAINRYGHSMATEGILPRAAARVHPKYKSPSFGNFQALLTGAIVVLFGLMGLDPYRQLTVWFSSPGTIGIMALMALTSVAVVVFFASKKEHPRGPRMAIIGASTLATLLIIGAIVSMIANIQLLTDADGVINLFVVLTPAIIFLAVFVTSAFRRSKYPDSDQRNQLTDMEPMKETS